MILMASKHDGSGLHTLTTTNDRAMDMKIFAPNLQTGIDDFIIIILEMLDFMVKK